MKRVLILLLGILLCMPVFAGDYKEVKGIAYRDGVNDEYINEMCRLDLAYEEGAADRPVIVWFHGGGLTGGYRHIPATLTREGAVVVGVGYRFVSKVDLSEVIDDAAAAVAWVMDNVAKFGGDESRIILAGHSAGGYLVDMLGLDKHWLGKYGVDADKMALIAPYSGQVITHFAQRQKMGIDNLTPLIDEYAPLFHIRKDAAPMLVISGDRDMELFGRYEETAYLVRMLRLKGHEKVTFYELDGFNHGDMVEPGHLLLLKYIKEHI